MKLKPLLIGSALVAVLMLVSNPSKERYSYYASEEFSEMGKEFLCSLDIPADGFKQLCGVALPVGKTVLKPVVELLVGQLTTPQNFFLFSIYTTDLGTKKFTTIAAFGNFYMFK
ncbi:MAG: hypothetical protein DCE90_11025 [Pseudanabaena sp.]|nr:MAG: hypothetical protein DCE90_11025 [Pseudanabaena sp.]